MDGFIDLYKEPGFTSHDCVAKLRGILKQKKIGHMGTLDPSAEGVLPIALGRATKLIELFENEKKTYEAVMLLGTVTDTLDTEGAVLGINPVNCSAEEIIAAVDSFKGTIEQVPPMYSALKVGGKKLYELAREGKSVERAARSVVIHDIQVISLEIPRVKMRVTCSKGTYIRTLCDDIGKKLGCGACMEHLVRTEASGFTAERAVRFADIEEKAADGDFGFVTPIGHVLDRYRQVKTDESEDKAAHNGNRLYLKGKYDNTPYEGEKITVYDSYGSLIGLYEYKESEKCFDVFKMLYDSGKQ